MGWRDTQRAVASGAMSFRPEAPDDIREGIGLLLKTFGKFHNLNKNTELVLAGKINEKLKNNIKEHFIEYLERYVNIMWKKKYLTQKIKNIKKTKRERERYQAQKRN